VCIIFCVCVYYILPACSWIRRRTLIGILSSDTRLCTHTRTHTHTHTHTQTSIGLVVSWPGTRDSVYIHMCTEIHASACLRVLSLSLSLTHTFSLSLSLTHSLSLSVYTYSLDFGQDRRRTTKLYSDKTEQVLLTCTCIRV